MRRWFGLLAMALSLSACSTDPDERIVIRVANWGGADDESDFAAKQRGLYEEFEKRNPDIKVVIEGIPGPGEYVPKMILAHNSGATPDIATLDASSSALFINSGMLMDLATLIDKDQEFKLNDFYLNIVDIARRGDAIYAIPNDFTPMVMYYNKRLFDASGVSYPQNGWTFDQFRETAKKLTKKDQYGFVFANWFPGWIMWLWNNGGDVFSPDLKRASGFLDSAENVKTIEFLRTMINDDKSAPSLSQAAAAGVDLFANGQAAMTVSGHWGMVGYSAAPKGPDGKPKITLADLGVVMLPNNTGKPVTVMYESGYAITKRAKHPDAAWRFIKFMTSYESRLVLNQTGIAVDARKDVSTERGKDPLEAMFLPIIPTCRPPYGTMVEGFEMVETQAQNAMDSVLKNGRDPKAALEKAAKRIDSELAKRQVKR
ncbi:MAG: sugar ABC transporter substrate-binding protein [Chlorobia bacterium]|nr:sugar ABC transporter substrate-binding protein [Fimbriimonadaceae bacterium]